MEKNSANVVFVVGAHPGAMKRGQHSIAQFFVASERIVEEMIVQISWRWRVVEAEAGGRSASHQSKPTRRNTKSNPNKMIPTLRGDVEEGRAHVLTDYPTDKRCLLQQQKKLNQHT